MSYDHKQSFEDSCRLLWPVFDDQEAKSNLLFFLTLSPEITCFLEWGEKKNAFFYGRRVWCCKSEQEVYVEESFFVLYLKHESSCLFWATNRGTKYSSCFLEQIEKCLKIFIFLEHFQNAGKKSKKYWEFFNVIFRLIFWNQKILSFENLFWFCYKW